jgi:hypothetical protein
MFDTPRGVAWIESSKDFGAKNIGIFLYRKRESRDINNLDMSVPKRLYYRVNPYAYLPS